VLTLIIVPLSVMGTGRPLGEILSDLSEKTRVQTDISRADYFFTEMRVITTYTRLLFLPVNQNLDYDYPIAHSLFSPPVLLSCLFLLSLLGLAGYLLYKSRQEAIGNGQWAKDESRQEAIGNGQAENVGPIASRQSPLASYRLIAFGILWFFITLSVESSVIPITDVIFEHRVYLPSAGAFISIAAACFLLAGRFGKGRVAAVKTAVMVFALVVVCLAGTTYARNRVWQDDLTLWRDVAAKSPGNARAHNDLGYVYLSRGDVDRALQEFQTALRLNPYYADARTNLGVAYYEKGAFYQAIEQFTLALKVTTNRPDVVNALHNLGLAYSRVGLLDDGLREMEAAAALEPGNAEVLNDLGVLYQRKGFTAKAIECYQNALKASPDDAGAHFNLGNAYESVGRHDMAQAHFKEAHRLSPERF
jgi:tetratricopeptide (TPR) repeat protein